MTSPLAASASINNTVARSLSGSAATRRSCIGDGGSVVLPLHRPCTELRERALIPASELLPFLFDPTLELRRARQMDSIEKGPGIDVDRGSKIAAGESRHEVGDVARDDVHGERKFVRADDTPFTERLPNDIQELIECSACTLGRALRPQQKQHAISRDSARSRGSQKRQKHKALSLIHRCGNIDVARFDGESAECSKAESRLRYRRRAG